MTPVGRSEDAVTAGITTTVVMFVTAVSPQHAWEQPILRIADTIVGVAVGITAVWIGQRVIALDRSSQPPWPVASWARALALTARGREAAIAGLLVRPAAPCMRLVTRGCLSPTSA